MKVPGFDTSRVERGPRPRIVSRYAASADETSAILAPGFHGRWRKLAAR